MAKDKDRELIDKMNSALTEEINEVLQKVLAQQLQPILKHLAMINGRLETLETRTTGLEKEQKKQGIVLKKVQKTLDVALRVFDRADVRLHKRIMRVEEHLHLSPLE